MTKKIKLNNQTLLLERNKMIWEDYYDKSIFVGKTKTQLKKPKLACFDLDNTLIKVIGKHVHPKDKNDWQFTFDCISNKLKELVKEE